MSMAGRLLERAISLSKAGNKLDARQILVEVLRQDPGNETAWLWYVDTFSAREEKIAALRRMLRVFPDHPNATRMLAIFERPAVEKAQPAPALRQPVPILGILAPIVFVVGICVFMFGSAGLLNRAGYALQISGLKDENIHLQGQVLDLTNRLTNLDAQYQGLLAAHQGLQSDYQALRNSALVPPYISVENRRMIISFIKLDQSEDRWEVEFQSLEDELYRGSLARDAIDRDGSMWVDLRNSSTGELYSVVDMAQFVDPSSFRQVIPTLYAESPSDEAFVREVWNIVTQLAVYSEEIAETPRYPLETFLAGGGDCEDTAILFASMILAAPVNWDVELVYLDLDHPTAPMDVDHVAVYVNTGSQEFLVETTEDVEMLPYRDGVIGWYFEVH